MPGSLMVGSDPIRELSIVRYGKHNDTEDLRWQQIKSQDFVD